MNKNKVFIIAEAGVNHNGRLDLALKLVDLCAKLGADAIKFQTFKAEQVVTREGEMAKYQQKNTGKKTSQQTMLKKIELPEEFYPKIIKRCRQKNILFLSTPHGGVKSVDLLEDLDIKLYKIGSGDLTNYLLLNRVAKTKKPIILSTGMATLKEVKAAIKFLRTRHCTNISVLHCTSDYPCPLTEVNLRAMLTLKKHLNVPIGYSDHTVGSQVAIMAVTLGAAIYEFHLTLDKNLPGPDHKASSSPEEAKERIDHIRNVEIILGNPSKRPTKIESASMIKIARRSLVAAHNLKKEHVIGLSDLEAKRPGTGVSPVFYEQFIGRQTKRDLVKDELLTFKNTLKHAQR